jgi:hypothetical protein
MPITSIKWDARNMVINSQVKDFATIVRNHKFKRLKTNKRPKKKRLDFRGKRKKRTRKIRKKNLNMMILHLPLN